MCTLRAFILKVSLCSLNWTSALRCFSPREGGHAKLQPKQIFKYVLESSYSPFSVPVSARNLFAK